MSATRRPLTVETFEDRALPSISYFAFNPWYEGSAQVSSYYQAPRPSQAFDSGLRASAWQEFNEATVFRFRVGRETWVFVWNPYGYGSGQSDGPGTTTPPQPSTGPISSPQESAGSVVADAVSTAASAAKATTPKATTTTGTANGVQANPAAAPIVSNTQSATPLAAAATTATEAAEQAAQAVVSQVFIPVAVQQTGTHASYTFIEGAQPTEGEALPPAPDGTAPKGDASPPAPDAPRAEGYAAAQGTEAAPAAGPTAGALPVNLADIRASTANFLGRVTGMAGEWADGTPTTEDYLWTAAAVLLVGGVVYSGRDKQAARPPRGPAGMDSALAEWEGDNARRAG